MVSVVLLKSNATNALLLNVPKLLGTLQSLIKVMEGEIWQYSIPVDADYARSRGCITILPIRVHSRNDIADEANERVVKDWDAFLGDGFAQKYGYRSGFSPGVGNWASFIFPESVPDRLAIVAYLADMGCIHDGQSA